MRTHARNFLLSPQKLCGFRKHSVRKQKQTHISEYQELNSNLRIIAQAAAI